MNELTDEFLIMAAIMVDKLFLEHGIEEKEFHSYVRQYKLSEDPVV